MPPSGNYLGMQALKTTILRWVGIVAQGLCYLGSVLLVAAFSECSAGVLRPPNLQPIALLTITSDLKLIVCKTRTQ